MMDATVVVAGRSKTLRGADLEDPSLVHDQHHVTEHHRLGGLGRRIDHYRVALVREEGLELVAQLFAQFVVEVGQWLVEQENSRAACEGARHGDALLLSAGELGRLAPLEAGAGRQVPGSC